MLHTGEEGYLREREDQADAFASAFLLPRVGFVREYSSGGSVDWDLIWDLKQRWKASGAAILMRAHDLGLVHADASRRAWKHYMYKRWNHGEPHEPAADAPELVGNALQLLAGRTSAAVIAEGLGWVPATLKEIVGDALPEEMMKQQQTPPLSNNAPSAVVLPFRTEVARQ